VTEQSPARLLRLRSEARGLLPSGLILGVGLGGFLDGIFLHQILQWHHLLTSAGGYSADTVRGLEANTVWDGLFHVMTWMFVVAGLALLWHTGQMGTMGSGRTVVGSVLGGWGLFNLVEGVISHHFLGIHHVREGPHELVYDLVFLSLGGLLLVVGWLLVRGSRRKTGSSRARVAEPAGMGGARGIVVGEEERSSRNRSPLRPRWRRGRDNWRLLRRSSFLGPRHGR
jgi:uncharacterized membrane protein